MDGADSRQAMKRSSLWPGSPRKRAGGLDAAQHSTAQHSTTQDFLQGRLPTFGGAGCSREDKGGAAE